jgi:predicted membrane chloride channel (bestrophin family)
MRVQDHFKKKITYSKKTVTILLAPESVRSVRIGIFLSVRGNTAGKGLEAFIVGARGHGGAFHYTTSV